MRCGKSVSRQSNKETRVIMKHMLERIWCLIPETWVINFLVLPDCQVLSLKTNQAQKNNRTKVIWSIQLETSGLYPDTRSKKRKQTRWTNTQWESRHQCHLSKIWYGSTTSSSLPSIHRENRAFGNILCDRSFGTCHGQNQGY